MTDVLDVPIETLREHVAAVLVDPRARFELGCQLCRFACARGLLPEGASC